MSCGVVLPLRAARCSRASPRLRGFPAALRLKAAATGPILSQVVASGNAIGLNWFPIGDSAPIAEHRLDQRQRRDRGGIGAQDARPERKPHHTRQLEKCRAFVVGKATFLANQNARWQRTRTAPASPPLEHMNV